MAECINCGKKEAVGRSKYCSGSCKVLYNRKQKRKQSQTVNTETVTKLNDSVTVTPKSVTAAAASDFKRTIKGMSATSRLTPVYTTEQTDILSRSVIKRLSRMGELPANFGQPDCECRHCRANRTNKSKNIINHGTWKPAGDLAKNEVNRVSLPGDVDYDGVCNSPEYDSRRITG